MSKLGHHRRSLAESTPLLTIGKFVLNRNKVLMVLCIVCQTLLLANGALTLAVDAIAEHEVKYQFDVILPKLNFLHSLSWRNWKIMESSAQSLIVGGLVNLQSEVISHHAAINFEASQSDYSEEIRTLAADMKNLTDGIFANNAISASYDTALLALDTASVNGVKNTSLALIDSLKYVQKITEITVYCNAVILGLVAIIRGGELYFGPKWRSKDKEASLHFAGVMSSTFLSILESAAFILITNYRLQYLNTLVEKDFILYEAAWQIKYLDPILTGSALRFSLSNSSEWTDRYNAAIDPLTAAYAELSKYDSSVISALNKLNADSNAVLVELETIALSNSSAGAGAITGLSYISNKAIYLFSVDSILRIQEQQLYAGLASTSTLCQALIYFAAVLTGISLLLFVTEISRLIMSKKVTDIVSVQDNGPQLPTIVEKSAADENYTLEKAEESDQENNQ